MKHTKMNVCEHSASSKNWNIINMLASATAPGKILSGLWSAPLLSSHPSLHQP